MAAEGYRHTHNLKKYLLRLFVFAVVSHFAYTFCFGISPIPFRDSVLNQTSVIWPLFLAVVALYVCDDEKRAFPLKVWQKTLLILLLCALAFPSDWSCFPVLCTLHIDANRGNLKKQVLGMLAYLSMYVLVWCLCIDVVYGLLQFGVVLVWPLMHFYNGTRGKMPGGKWFFYFFYAGHLFLCGLLSSPSARLERLGRFIFPKGGVWGEPQLPPPARGAGVRRHRTPRPLPSRQNILPEIAHGFELKGALPAARPQRHAPRRAAGR